MTSRRSLLAVVCLVLPGCAQQVFVPPSRPLTLHPARTVGEGRSSVQVQGSVHGAIFGPELSAGNVQVHHGLGERVDVAIDGTILHAHDSAASTSHPNVYAGRIGVRAGPDEVLSVVGGVGGGTSAGGPFVNADAGLVLALENRYLVPFIGVGAFVGVPLDPRPVDVTEAGDGERVYDTPTTTVGWNMSLGLKLPIDWRPPHGAPLSILGGFGFHHVRDAHDEEVFFAWALGVETNF